jgi:hypothetical protein
MITERAFSKRCWAPDTNGVCIIALYDTERASSKRPQNVLRGNWGGVRWFKVEVFGGLNLEGSQENGAQRGIGIQRQVKGGIGGFGQRVEFGAAGLCLLVLAEGFVQAEQDQQALAH